MTNIILKINDKVYYPVKLPVRIDEEYGIDGVVVYLNKFDIVNVDKDDNEDCLIVKVAHREEGNRYTDTYHAYTFTIEYRNDRLELSMYMDYSKIPTREYYN